MEQSRIYPRNDKHPSSNGNYILYRIQIHRRFNWNHALQYAIERANEHDKPLLIYEGLRCDYPWASDRFHQFIMESMAELQQQARKNDIFYLPIIEHESGEEQYCYQQLAKKAVEVISDEYPVFIMREQNQEAAAQCPVTYTTVDGNGVLPLSLSDKAPYNAYFFRKIVQKKFVDCYTRAPKENPLDNLTKQPYTDIPEEVQKRAGRTRQDLAVIESVLEDLPVNHEVPPVMYEGTRKTALDMLDNFIENRLHRYDEEANQPDNSAASNLSPWLHFGKISPFEITRRIFEQQPGDWSLEDIEDRNGSRGDFFSADPNIESFMDELITWREVGFHFIWHEKEFDTFASLPDWARETLNDHRGDERPYIYSLEEFEHAQTHDELWNAAQRQLRSEGIIHNYLRMLWGKKILEWTPDPETALAYMIELNNKYATDGRDPNSYNGIFWCLGRFDRPWPERKIYGKIRYMTSKSTRKKCRLDNYLEKFGREGQRTLDI